MSAFDYSVAAGLCCAKGSKTGLNALEYKRFAQVAVAIRFAMEDIPANALQGCSLEAADETYVGAAIRPLSLRRFEKRASRAACSPSATPSPGTRPRAASGSATKPS